MIINFPSIPRNLISNAIDYLIRGDQIALVTLVNIEGNAPYPVGSQMMVNQAGEYLGQITGGCAETALAEQAVTLIKQKTNTSQRYGLNSPFFDIQLPCGSGIDVYFDVEATLSIYQKINAQLQQRSVAQITLETETASFVKHFQPNERLIIFGQGPILTHLAELAISSGFEVLCVAQDYKSIEQLHSAGISACDLPTGQKTFIEYCDSYTALVSLFHEHDLETAILGTALEQPLFYIGALGSKLTHCRRIDALLKNGYEKSAIDKICGPIGMDIKAQTPAYIAISILAEIIGNMPKA